MSESSLPADVPAADLAGIGAAYHAPEGLAETMAASLARRGVRIAAWHGALALSPDPPAPEPWAQNIWTSPRLIPAASIGAAADALRAVQRNWGPYFPAHGGRGKLIVERLPRLLPKPLPPMTLPPAGHLGAFTLLAPDLLLASPTQSSPFINGEVQFVEDRDGPPSRAYLKLWEAWARIGQWPCAGQSCLDLGASPGGWSFAIAACGAQVCAVDKAPLDARVSAMPGVSTRLQSAFALDPAQEAPVDWLFSDVIAYPQRLLGLVQQWIAAGKAARVLCTLKFQGETDHAAADGFAAIPGGRLMHLYVNKHELTFFWQRG